MNAKQLAFGLGLAALSLTLQAKMDQELKGILKGGWEPPESATIVVEDTAHLKWEAVWNSLKAGRPVDALDLALNSFYEEAKRKALESGQTELAVAIGQLTPSSPVPIRVHQELARGNVSADVANELLKEEGRRASLWEEIKSAWEDGANRVKGVWSLLKEGNFKDALSLVGGANPLNHEAGNIFSEALRNGDPKLAAWVAEQSYQLPGYAIRELLEKSTASTPKEPQ